MDFFLRFTIRDSIHGPVKWELVGKIEAQNTSLNQLQTSDAVGRKPELMHYPTFHLKKTSWKLKNAMEAEIKIVYIVYNCCRLPDNTCLLVPGKFTSFGGPTKRRPFSKFP